MMPSERDSFSANSVSVVLLHVVVTAVGGELFGQALLRYEWRSHLGDGHAELPIALRA